MSHLTQEEREKLRKLWANEYKHPLCKEYKTDQIADLSDWQDITDCWLSQIDKILEESDKKEQEELKLIKDTLDAVYEKLTSL